MNLKAWPVFFVLFAVSRGMLSQKDCETLSKDELMEKAEAILSAMDVLLKDDFPQQFKGGYALIVDDSSGQDNGGGTNPNGYYATSFFNGTEILPPGACDIPKNDGKTPRCTPDEPWTDSFMLGPRDVMVMVGCTAPEVEYFSYDVIIDVRMTPEFFYPGINFGDTVNNVHMAHALETDPTSPDLFNRPIMYGHSADSTSGNAVLKAFAIATDHDAGASSHVRGIDTSVVRLWDRSEGADWQDTKPDVMSIIGRVSVPLPGNEEAYERSKGLQFPMRYYRAPDEYSAPEVPYKMPIIPRENANIMDEYTALGSAFHQLKLSVNASWTKDPMEVHGMPTARYVGTSWTVGDALGFYDDWDEWLAIPQNGTFPAGTRDAIYGLPVPDSADTWYYAPSRMGTLIGVMHTRTQQAAFSSVGVSLYRGAASVFGVYGMVDEMWFGDDDLIGSARRYLPAGYEGFADMLFAIDVMAPGQCAAAAQPKWCVELNNTEVLRPSAKKPYWGVGERVYANAVTGVGPSVNYTIMSELLVYDSDTASEFL